MANEKTAAPATTPANPVSGFVPVVVKQVTLPILKKVDDVTAYVAITGKIFTGKQVSGKDAEKMEPAQLANVVNLETGEECQIICNSVLKSTLEENYENASYVGKAFAITQYKVAGKRYKNYKISEIENPLKG